MQDRLVVHRDLSQITEVTNFAIVIAIMVMIAVSVADLLASVLSANLTAMFANVSLFPMQPCFRDFRLVILYTKQIWLQTAAIAK
jgi:hypothetical protein